MSSAYACCGARTSGLGPAPSPHLRELGRGLLGLDRRFLGWKFFLGWPLALRRGFLNGRPLLLTRLFAMRDGLQALSKFLLVHLVARNESPKLPTIPAAPWQARFQFFHAAGLT